MQSLIQSSLNFSLQLIPIETSMAENRHRFPLYLHLAIGGLSVILACFGILGYLVYGEEVEQIVTESFPPGVLILVVRFLLCIAILLTYPLQIFPVIEIVEGWLFQPETRAESKETPISNDLSCTSSEDSASCLSQVDVVGSVSECSRLLAPDIPKQKSRVSDKKSVKYNTSGTLLYRTQIKSTHTLYMYQIRGCFLVRWENRRLSREKVATISTHMMPSLHGESNPGQMVWEKSEYSHQLHHPCPQLLN